MERLTSTLHTKEITGSMLCATQVIEAGVDISFGCVVRLLAGMLVPAAEYTCPVAQGIFLHFKKERDSGLDSGKLDEELLPMSRIVDRLQKGALVLVENQVEVFSVTHLFSFADQIYQQHRADPTFLRAERLADGTRTFQMHPGQPLQTACGMDLYHKIFSAEGQSAPK